MEMGMIIREKRKALGMTQEQVADTLGVSAPAVNKWEKGSSCPDVALLSPLARLLKTDVNTLLGFRENLTTQEIALFCNEIAQVSSEDAKRAFAMVKEKVQEYPACAELLQTLATILQGLMVMRGYKMEDREVCEKYIAGLYERVAALEDPKFSGRARYMLAGRSIQEENYEKAQELIDALPEYEGLDRRDLQVQLWMRQEKNAEAARLLEGKLQMNIQTNMMLLDKLAVIAVREGNPEEAEELARCSQKEMELFQMWGYGGYVALLDVAIEKKDAEQTLEILEEMLDALLVPWNPQETMLFRHFPKTDKQTDFGKEALPVLLKSLEESPEYEFMRSEPEFWRILEKYHDKIKNF